MAYDIVVSRAWTMVRNNRYLCWIGLLALWVEGANGLGLLFMPNIYNSSASSNLFSPIIYNPGTLSISRYIYHSINTIAPHITKCSPICRISINDWSTFPPIIILVLGFVVFFLYISHSASAGLIIFANAADKEDKTPGFWALFARGRRYAWRLFGMNVYLYLALIFAMILLILPIILLLFISRTEGIMAVVSLYGPFAILAWLTLFAYITILIRLAGRALVLQDINVSHAIYQARRIIREQLARVFTSFMVALFLRFAYTVILSLTLVAAIAILIGIGNAVYIATHASGTTVYGFIVSMAVITLLLSAKSYFTAFTSIYWTLVYKHLQTR